MPKHLIFYDGQCGLCDYAVQFVLKRDTTHQFAFAPLQGKTASIMLQDLPEHLKGADSLILIEDYASANPHFYILGKGALRICWLLGGGWVLLGWLSWLPSFCYDWAYRLVARNRHSFFDNDRCVIPDPTQKNRFLP